MNSVVPAPVSVEPRQGSFALADATVTGVGATYAAQVLGLPLADEGNIQLVLGQSASGGYELEVSESGIRIESSDEAGLFAGVQTLRQLIADGTVDAVVIKDAPRFAYRGAMLDIVRHFFTVDSIKRYIDDIALLKLNYLHLHLTDDQGWRVHIDSWPNLTAIGAATQVGGGGGGFLTKDDYRDIVEYAASRFVTIVPEIDVPGHTNAVLASYPELNPDSVAVAAYEGTEVGFSTLDISSERTYEFLTDVIREVAQITPGPYLHLGGDESLATTDEDFLAFIARVTAIAAVHGKTIIGWHEMGRSRELPVGTVGQYWNFTTPQEGHAEHAVAFVEQGGRVIMSPGDVAYLDMKYDADTRMGLVWANGPTPTRDSYEWEPAEILEGIDDDQILGVEAPIWTESITTVDELEFMAFPRLAAIAEIAWSPRAPRNWVEFEPRLTRFTQFLDAQGINHN